jgi:glycolate oxidase FAD binding subunit
LRSVSSLEQLSALLAGGERVRVGETHALDGLARVLEHEAGDLTVVAEAGLRLSALNALLAADGQRLALDPPGDPTLGAVLAGAKSGPLRHRYGGPRDLVLGVTLVLADGTVASSGGKVVKNVAGYDLAKLVCGSGGTLGVIVRAAFRLHPLPRAARTLAVPVASPEEAQTLAQRVLRATFEPGAFDLVFRNTSDSRALLRFEGTERAVDAQLGAARALLGGDEVDGAVWDEVRARQGAMRGRVAFDPGRLDEALRAHPDAVVRVAAGTAYVPGPRPAAPSPLADRVRASFDPLGLLAR